MHGFHGIFCLQTHPNKNRKNLSLIWSYLYNVIKFICFISCMDKMGSQQNDKNENMQYPDHILNQLYYDIFKLMNFCLNFIGLY